MMLEHDNGLWIQARSRMRTSVETFLRQETDISDEATAHCSRWILDRIFMPEFFGALDAPVWSVMRQDDNGNHFIIERQLQRSRAHEIKDLLEGRGHKQFYWVEPCMDH